MNIKTFVKPFLRSAAALLVVGAIHGAGWCAALDVNVDNMDSVNGNLRVTVANSSGAIVTTATQTVTGGQGSIPVTFSGLTPSDYIVYAFIDENGNGFPDSWDAMGGCGGDGDNNLAPFPVDSTVVPVYPVEGSSATYNLVLTKRSAIRVTLSNISSQVGNILLKATPEAFNWDTDRFKIRQMTLGSANGVFTLDKLDPAVGTYQVEAFIDKTPPNYSRDDLEDQADPIVGLSLVGGTANEVSMEITDSYSQFTGSFPESIQMQDEFGGGYQALLAGSTSTKLNIAVKDQYWQATSTSAPTSIQFFVWGPNEPLNFSLDLSTGAGAFHFSTTTAQIGFIPANVSASPSFQFYVSSMAAPGWYGLSAMANNFPTTGQNRWAWYNFRVLSGGSGFAISSFRTDSGTQGSLTSPLTITPNYDGSNDQMVLEFTAPQELQWECLISTVNFETAADVAILPENVVARQGGWSWGGTQAMWWDGYNQNDNWRKVPNGQYFVRLQAAGGAIVSPVYKVKVETGVIFGKVAQSLGGPGIPDVQVDCWGPNSGGQTRTDANGQYKISGLTIGSKYTLNFSKPGNETKRLESVQAEGGDLGKDAGEITLGAGGSVRIEVSVSTPSTYDLWGSVNVHDSNWSKTGWGSIRVRAGTTTADNGRWYESEDNKDPDYSTYTLIGMAPGDYTVDLELPQFGRYSSTVTVYANEIATVTKNNWLRKASISGALSFGSPYQLSWGTGECMNCGEWISVDAIKSGENQPSAWGGGDIRQGATSTTYRLDGLDPGTYQLRAFARGYKTQVANITVAATDQIKDFGTFQTGGVITGKVIVHGDTTGLGNQSQNMGGWAGGCGTGKFSVNINAWSPNSYMGSYQQICVNENASYTEANVSLKGLDDGLYYIWTWLPGFQIEPPEMPKKVTVSNSVGTANVTFRKLSGIVALTVTLPAGSTPALVQYQLQNYQRGGGDQISKSGSLSASGTAQIEGLGTGLYELSLYDPYSGLRKQVGLTVTNGRTTTQTVDMSVATKHIKGTVSVNGTISLVSHSTDTSVVNSVTVSSAIGLYEKSVFAKWDNERMQFVEMRAPRIQVFSLPLRDWGRSEPYFEANASTGAACSQFVGNPNFDINKDACFDFGGFVQGLYLVKVQEDLDPPMEMSYCPDCDRPGKPDLASTSKTLFVDTVDVSTDLKITNGVKLSGTISRPSGDTDRTIRFFTLKLRRSDNSAVWQTSATTTGAGSATYEIPHLGEGDYSLELTEGDPYSGGAMMTGPTPKYAFAPKRVTIGASDLVQNITLAQAGTIVGKLRDSDSNTLLTSANVEQFLPNGYYLNAQSDPWFPGGYANAEWDMSHVKISSSTNQFTIYRIIPDHDYNVTAKIGDSGFNMQSAAQGQKAYSPLTKSGIRVAAGQTVDVGILDLKQGVSITGSITDKSGNPLPNIQVAAEPSLAEGSGSWESRIQAFTDADGKYTLLGVDRGQLYYDVIASPRFEGGDDMFKNLGGAKYGEERIRMVDVTDDAMRTGVNFSLTEANCSVSGLVRTVDGGIMSTPFGDGGREKDNRRAAVMLHLEGVAMGDNPLGEIEEQTDVTGRFQINGLKPGSYTVRIISLGYASAKKNIVISAGNTDLGTITLEKGATVSGKITKPNGSYPSSGEAGIVVGVDDDFEEFNFGMAETNETTDEVTGYKITGFKPGVTYSLLMVGEEGKDIILGKTGVTFASATDDKTINLVYQAPRPQVYVSQSRSGSLYTLRFFSTQKLRNLTTDDSDLTKIVTLASGGGQVLYSSSTIGASRDNLTVLYQAPANERSFILRVTFTTNKEDPNSLTGEDMVFGPRFIKFYAGAARMRMVQVSNLLGGEAILQGDPTGSNYIPGAFEVDRSSSVEVGVVSAADLESLLEAPSAAAPARTPAVRALSVQKAASIMGPEAYPSESLYAAVQMAPAVSPFSAFYDIFLPAGVNHQLKKEALLSLKYDASVTDTSKLNVYYYDPNNNVFLLENSKRRVDEVNKTITVAVSHASTFVVLNNNAAIVGSNTYSGTEIFLHNFPNPFNLKTKTVTLNKAGSVTSASQSIEGTMIRLALPPGMTGTVKFEIYNVAGELVRTITESAPTGGTYYYIPWDGRNDGGKQVASGVYFARFTLNGSDERIFKMAVVK